MTMIEDIQSKVTGLGNAYTKLEGIVALQGVSQKKLMNVTGDLTKVMEVQTNLLTKAQQVTQKVAKTTTSTSTTTEDFAKAVTDSVKAILDQEAALKEADRQRKDFGHGLTAAGQPITEFNKRTELVSTTIRRLRDEYGILQFDLTRPETFQIYKEEGGNRLEFLAEFISSSREEVAIFGAEAAKARKVLYGFAPPGMFRMLNKLSSVFQFFGGAIRRSGDNADENNNILGNTIKVMRKLTKEGKGLNPFREFSKSSNKFVIELQKAQAEYDVALEAFNKESSITIDGESADDKEARIKPFRDKMRDKEVSLTTAKENKEMDGTIKSLSRGFKSFKEATKENAKAFSMLKPINFDKLFGVDEAISKEVADAKKALADKENELFVQEGLQYSKGDKLGDNTEIKKRTATETQALAEALKKQKDARQQGFEKIKAKTAKITGKFIATTRSAISFVFKTAMKYMALGGMALIAIGVIATKILPNIIDHFGLFFELFMGLIGVFMPVVAMIGSGLERIIDGFIEGDLEEIIAGVFEFAVGVIAGLGVVVLTLGAFLLSAAISFLSGLFKTIYEFLLGGKNGFFSFAGRALTLVLAVLIGIKIATMFNSPAYMAVAIMGILFVVLKKAFKEIGLFANGGVVNTPLQVVGEKGPELVNLPRGSRVHSNADSRKMVGSGGSVVNNISVTINAKDTSKSEMRRIAKEIGNMINKEINRGVSSSTTR